MKGRPGKCTRGAFVCDQRRPSLSVLYSTSTELMQGLSLLYWSSRARRTIPSFLYFTRCFIKLDFLNVFGVNEKKAAGKGEIKLVQQAGRA